jgi:hypothetical protein
MTAAIASPVPAVSFFAPAHGYKPLARFITSEALVELLLTVRGAKIVSIETRTEPRLLAKHPSSGAPNPFKGNVVKVSRVNGIINWRYGNSVNRQRVREGLAPDFAAVPRKWGVRLPGTPLVEHDGRTYLELKVERFMEQRYDSLDGRELPFAAVEAYLPSRGASRQGVEREIVVRDYDLANIVSLRLDGVVYLVRARAATEEDEPSFRRSA